MKFQRTVLVYASDSRDESRIVYRTHAENASRLVALGRATKRDGKGKWVHSISLVRTSYFGPMPVQDRLSRLMSAGHKHQSVSKRHQDPGAPQWVKRPDNARSGQMRGIGRVWFGGQEAAA